MMVAAEAWTIPDDIVPGVFFARLVMEDPPPHWRTDASEIQPSRKFANRCWDTMRCHEMPVFLSFAAKCFLTRFEFKHI